MRQIEEFLMRMRVGNIFLYILVYSPVYPEYSPIVKSCSMGFRSDPFYRFGNLKLI